MKTLGILLACTLALVFAGSCKKDQTSTPPPSTVAKGTPYYVKMTDAPGNYSAVHIDLQAVEVIGSGNATYSLITHAGVYDLMRLSNGDDTLIASGTLNTSRVEQIRLILGNNNSVVTHDGVSHPLKTPSAQQSGLKLQVHHNLEAGVAYYVLLDFDASRSIVEEGNGEYSLKPVIRTIESALGGAIKGKVSKPGVMTTVTASNGGGSYSTIVNAIGEFILSGLPPGAYSLDVNPVSPYTSSTTNNVIVVTAVTTDVGTIGI